MGADVVDNIMRVGNASPVEAVANSIYRAICVEGQLPTLRAIGVGAVNQACKAIAIATGLVGQSGRHLATTVGFDNVEGRDGEQISAQTFHLFLR